MKNDEKQIKLKNVKSLSGNVLMLDAESENAWENKDFYSTLEITESTS